MSTEAGEVGADMTAVAPVEPLRLLAEDAEVLRPFAPPAACPVAA
jgi:hypothetical protein